MIIKSVYCHICESKHYVCPEDVVMIDGKEVIRKDFRKMVM